MAVLSARAVRLLLDDLDDALTDARRFDVPGMTVSNLTWRLTMIRDRVLEVAVADVEVEPVREAVA